MYFLLQILTIAFKLDKNFLVTYLKKNQQQQISFYLFTLMRMYLTQIFRKHIF